MRTTQETGRQVCIDSLAIADPRTRSECNARCRSDKTSEAKSSTKSPCACRIARARDRPTPDAFTVRRPHVSKNADTRLLSVEFYEKCPGAGAVTLTIEVTYTLCLS